jgi:hypothetical protein
VTRSCCAISCSKAICSSRPPLSPFPISPKNSAESLHSGLHTPHDRGQPAGMRGSAAHNALPAAQLGSRPPAVTQRNPTLQTMRKNTPDGCIPDTTFTTSSGESLHSGFSGLHTPHDSGQPSGMRGSALHSALPASQFGSKPPDTAFTMSSDESSHFFFDSAGGGAAAAGGGEDVSASEFAGVDGAAAGPHAFPHAVFSAPVLLAQPMKQAAHSGAEPVIPTTADVGSVAVATDMSCCWVHGPDGADSTAVTSSAGGGAGGGADGAAAGPHAFPHAVFSAPVLLAQPMKQAAHSGAEPIIPPPLMSDRSPSQRT